MSETLDLISQLCQALEAEGVVYCHWKSTAALDRSARGDNDLDLLVSRADAPRLTEILCRLGFKEARLPPERQLPGVLVYFGYDRAADKFVQVHAHYQLILGDDMTKNVRLPIERPFLESALPGGVFKIPAPEFEFIVFVIRMVLKYSTWDAMLLRQGDLPATARREFEYLEPRVNWTRLYAVLQEHLPYVGATLFDRCVRCLRPDCPVWTRLQVGRALYRALHAHTRRPPFADTYLKLWRRGSRSPRRRIFRHPPRKHMAYGGALIALVGGDGAGKSTAVDELYTWLSKDFDTIKVHLGKPPRSWVTLVVKGALKMGGWLGAFRKTKVTVPSGADHRFPGLTGYLQLMWRVARARDRYRAYVKARRFATNDGYVVCDRFPLPQVKLMDGARSDQMIDFGRGNRLVEFLVQAEKRYYRQIMLPELLIVLRVDPEIAVQRKTDEEAASVRARSQEIWELDWQQTHAHVIDAGRSEAEVLAELKSLVWSEL